MYNPHKHYDFDKDWAYIEWKNSLGASVCIDTYSPSTIEIDWGDGTIENYANHAFVDRVHLYNAPFTGFVKVRVKGGRLSMVNGLKIYSLTNNFVVTPETISQFPKVKSVYISGLDSIGIIKGEFAETLPETIEYLRISNTAHPESNATFNFGLLSKYSRLTEISTNNTRGQSKLKILGNVTDIPQCMEVIDLTDGLNELVGDISNIPDKVNYFSCSGNLSIYGNIATLKPTLNTFAITDNNNTLILKGDIKDIPTGIVSFTINSSSNSNDITGNVANLPLQVLNLKINCKNTIYGFISSIGNRNEIIIEGQNTITGELTSFVLVKNLFIGGYNEISGDITTLPSKVQNINIRGYNTIYGDIGNIGNRSICKIEGQNTIGGQLGGNTKVIELRITGSNDIKGNLKDLLVGKNIDIQGNNTISGDIKDIPYFIQYLVIEGQNTLTGNLADFRNTNISQANIGGLANINNYTNISWNDKTINFLYLRSAGHTLTSEKLDQLLIDMANSSINWITPKRLYLDGKNIGSRTHASDNAVQTLMSKGVSFILKNAV